MTIAIGTVLPIFDRTTDKSYRNLTVTRLTKTLIIGTMQRRADGTAYELRFYRGRDGRDVVCYQQGGGLLPDYVRVVPHTEPKPVASSGGALTATVSAGTLSGRFNGRDSALIEERSKPTTKPATKMWNPARETILRRKHARREAAKALSDRELASRVIACRTQTDRNAAARHTCIYRAEQRRRLIARDVAPAEMAIARTILKVALHNCGWSVRVYDGEDVCVRNSTDLETIVSALATTDSDTLTFFGLDGQKLGSVWLIWGNGEDLISDCTDNASMHWLTGHVA